MTLRPEVPWSSSCASALESTEDEVSLYYTAQTLEQMRNTAPLTLDEPPAVAGSLFPAVVNPPQAFPATGRISHGRCGLPSTLRLLGSSYQCITWPPSTLMVWPVICRLLAEERNTTMSAISSGSCHRARGATARTFSSAQSSYDRCWAKGC
jgi:hypothetical protein